MSFAYVWAIAKALRELDGKIIYQLSPPNWATYTLRIALKSISPRFSSLVWASLAGNVFRLGSVRLARTSASRSIYVPWLRSTVYGLQSTVHDGLPVPLWARRYALHVQQVEIITTRATRTGNILSYLCNRNAMKILKELTFLQMFLGNGIRIFSSMPVSLCESNRDKNISYKHFMFESKLFLLQIQLFKFKFKSKLQRQHLFISWVFGGLGSRKCFHLSGY